MVTMVVAEMVKVRSIILAVQTVIRNLSRIPNPSPFAKLLPSDGRRTAVQIGAALQYNWEV